MKGKAPQECLDNSISSASGPDTTIVALAELLDELGLVPCDQPAPWNRPSVIRIKLAPRFDARLHSLGGVMRVFLSYSRGDTAIADRMVADLEARGIDVDIDRRDLPYGEEWQDELAGFIRRADTVVWLASAASVTSHWCKWELGEAQRASKRVLPVRISALAPEDLPEALGRIHILPVEGSYDPARHLDDLVAAIETNRAWIEMHARG